MLAGDVSEIMSRQYANDPQQLRALSQRLRFLLTGENGSNLFAGSQGALLREIQDVDILYVRLDDADPNAARRRITLIRQSLADAKKPVKVLFGTSNRHLLRDGQFNINRFGSSDIMFVDPASVPTFETLKTSVEKSGFISSEQWQAAQIRVVMPRSYGDELKSFVVDANQNSKQLHVYMALTDTENPTLIELFLPDIEKLDLSAESRWLQKVLAQEYLL
jgi:hypothetical protein